MSFTAIILPLKAALSSNTITYVNIYFSSSPFDCLTLLPLSSPHAPHSYPPEAAPTSSDTPPPTPSPSSSHHIPPKSPASSGTPQTLSRPCASQYQESIIIGLQSPLLRLFHNLVLSIAQGYFAASHLKLCSVNSHGRSDRSYAAGLDHPNHSKLT